MTSHLTLPTRRLHMLTLACRAYLLLFYFGSCFLYLAAGWYFNGGRFDNLTPLAIGGLGGLLHTTASSCVKYLDRLPAPDAALPGGWRERCDVVCRPDGDWDARTPGDTHWLHPVMGWRDALPTDREVGWFKTEQLARSALAAAQPWPGYVAPEAVLPWGCVLVERRGDGSDPQLNNYWQIESASGDYWWGLNDGWCRNQRSYPALYTRNLALANPPTEPPPDYTPPAPSKPESVDAAYMAANAGEYRNDEGETFRSDGRGSVTVTLCDGRQKQWVGVHLHQAEPATRFRPLPPATPASKPESPAPSPVEGEPKFPYQDAAYPDRIKGWKCADKAWRAHTASLRSSLAAARAEVERANALTFADVDRSALRIVKGLPTVEAEARNDVRSSPAYWNGDDWESISGSHDAREWMDQQLAQYVSKEILKLLNPPL